MKEEGGKPPLFLLVCLGELLPLLQVQSAAGSRLGKEQRAFWLGDRLLLLVSTLRSSPPPHRRQDQNPSGPQMGVNGTKQARSECSEVGSGGGGWGGGFSAGKAGRQVNFLWLG